MFVGVLVLTFHVPHARSLKDKRSVTRRIKDRIRGAFDVSMAEVGDQNLHQRITFGVSVVSCEAAVCDGVLDQVCRLAEMDKDAVLTSRATEILPLGRLHGGVHG